MRHRMTELGDSREQAVGCLVCLELTWNVCGACDTHCHDPEAVKPAPPPALPETRYHLTEEGRMLLGVRRDRWEG